MSDAKGHSFSYWKKTAGWNNWWNLKYPMELP